MLDFLMPALLKHKLILQLRAEVEVTRTTKNLRITFQWIHWRVTRARAARRRMLAAEKSSTTAKKKLSHPQNLVRIVTSTTKQDRWESIFCLGALLLRCFWRICGFTIIFACCLLFPQICAVFCLDQLKNQRRRGEGRVWSIKVCFSDSFSVIPDDGFGCSVQDSFLPLSSCYLFMMFLLAADICHQSQVAKAAQRPRQRIVVDWAEAKTHTGEEEGKSPKKK